MDKDRDMDVDIDVDMGRSRDVLLGDILLQGDVLLRRRFVRRRFVCASMIGLFLCCYFQKTECLTSHFIISEV